MQGADRRIAGLWLGLLAFLVYGSWAPLALQAQPLPEAWALFLALPGPWQGPFSRTDLAVNFLLAVPLGFGAAYLAATVRAPQQRLGLLLLAWPALLLVSVCVEFGQVFFPPRTPSWTDVAMQALGSATGLLLFAVLGQPAQALVADLSGRLPVAQRLERWLSVYLLLLLAWQVMPLDLTLSPVELYRKWRDGRVLLLPFTALPAAGWDAAWQLGADLLIWMPVGALGWLALPRPGLGGLLGRAVAVVAAVEFAQLFVLSRVSDVTDVFVGSAGVLAGAVVARLLRRWDWWPEPRRRGLLHAALAAWLLVVVMVLWAPFDFDPALSGGSAAWDALARWPFASYFGRTEYGALGEILRKLVVFVPGGFLLALLARGDAPAAAPRLLVLGALALLLEAGQLWLPSKWADATDAGLGLLGAALGWRLGRSLANAAPGELLPSAAGQAHALRRRRPPPPVQLAATGDAAPGVAGPAWPWVLLRVLALALGLWLLARLPGVPYNVTRLMPDSLAGGLSALGVALALAWLLAAPLWLLAPQRRAWRLALPAWLLGHALVAFVALRMTVPLEMLHKVIGTPVLGWGTLAVVEDAGRYAALHAAIVLPLLGAAWLVRVVTAPRTLADLLWWAACALLLLGPVHGVVVAAAGTDNLVELMRGGGGLLSSLALASGWGALATAGAALAAAWAAPASGGERPWRRGPLLLLALLAAPLAPALLNAGLEPALFKYERLFSAAQFLLSAGRDRYAQGAELLLRACLALGGVGLLVAVLQGPLWRALAQGSDTRARPWPARQGPRAPAQGAAG